MQAIIIILISCEGSAVPVGQGGEGDRRHARQVHPRRRARLDPVLLHLRPRPIPARPLVVMRSGLLWIMRSVHS